MIEAIETAKQLRQAKEEATTIRDMAWWFIKNTTSQMRDTVSAKEQREEKRDRNKCCDAFVTRPVGGGKHFYPKRLGVKGNMQPLKMQ